MATDECCNLGKGANVVDLAAMGTGSRRGFRLHDDALNVLQGDFSSAFVAFKLCACFVDDLVEKAAALGIEITMRDEVWSAKNEILR